MRRASLLENTLMLGQIEGKRRRGQQRMRWLNVITNSMDMNLGKLQVIMGDRGTWRATVQGGTKSQTRLNNNGTEHWHPQEDLSPDSCHCHRRDPSCCPCCSQYPIKLEDLRGHTPLIHTFLNSGLLRPSNSPYYTPVQLVKRQKARVV